MILNVLKVNSFTKKEKALTKKLNTPAKVQDFLNRLPFNFEKRGETLRSPLFALRAKRAHCFEGALLGAYILSQHGFRPFLMHLKAQKEDYDHVIAPFKIGKFWGALSKTNHAVLRYREPVYGNIRELAMSYFHEYFLNNGQKTLRQYSALLNLNMVKKNWATSKEDLWSIDKALDRVKHYDMVPKSHIKNLRRADEIEIKAGKIVEWRN
ncbi:MAG: hypothetical protein UW01_C0007G0015 [Candidatus Nomurabacteria bacterium GW2011_GWA2_43_66]|uniref:Transglutaminase-like domain-containing protein n=1 Tax=Candidatus Nomurabacteria bacterium GW2011_GWF2_43_24 TaxID=1618778 RepID=A0A0G1GVD2_9BACT|nr:MAG: hypothetical protein UV13_C0002G0029 [Parcubacteria group bacterium GW2011_GWC1_42_21]KKS58621.1 MAG: hypothetical protein UV23_C0003G0005 [Candidatus Nomurabacteria bacterium GW2011_GWF1_42_40]KKT00384.1 MAG: hypothetical protein UV77_C0004G0016 [Candidatus Nomurabacteria bacterium GW2011_GWA1_43_17]KKT07527.1 MAG: hypothetical protein UV85_C0010G0005 [Candidatus Nomurabacteria bacterium GW2011_GWB1_43_19]KKT11337.1 MAG: hypothetical protein UV91_C0007G0037 [Candidatus Nomurabacteria b